MLPKIHGRASAYSAQSLAIIQHTRMPSWEWIKSPRFAPLVCFTPTIFVHALHGIQQCNDIGTDWITKMCFPLCMLRLLCLISWRRAGISSQDATPVPRKKKRLTPQRWSNVSRDFLEILSADIVKIFRFQILRSIMFLHSPQRCETKLPNDIIQLDGWQISTLFQNSHKRAKISFVKYICLQAFFLSWFYFDSFLCLHF